MPNVTNEGARISDWLKWEEDHRYSRDSVTVAPNQTLAQGEVVGRNAAGQIVAYDDAPPDGDVAVGIMCEAVTTGASTTAKSVIIARQAHVVRSGLVFKGAVTAPQQTNAMADLAALGIIPLAEPIVPTTNYA